MVFFVENIRNHFNSKPVGILNFNEFLVCMIPKMKKTNTALSCNSIEDIIRMDDKKRTKYMLEILISGNMAKLLRQHSYRFIKTPNPG